jgi:hypothetical protein
VTQQLAAHSHPESTTHPVILVRATPVWPYDPVLPTQHGGRIRVVPCASVLAVWEQLVADQVMPCAVLTDLPQDELGAGVLSRVFRRRLIDMEPWGLIAECFGAQQLDPRLEALGWAGRALIEAMPPGGWPRLAGTVLSRDSALRHLAAVRLGLADIDVAPEDIDAAVLLRWSALPQAAHQFQALTASERSGLFNWLVEQFGAAVQVLRALLDSGHCSDALPIGLVCESLWAADDPKSLRAQGRVEQYLGGTHLEPAVVRSFAATATRTVSDLLRPGAGQDGERMAHRILDRAEELTVGFAAAGVARLSQTMRSGFDYRLGVVADALIAALVTPPNADPASTSDTARDTLAVAARASADLEAHHLAVAYRHRVERVRMALRLVGWLSRPGPPPGGFAEWIDRQMAELSWVDLALAHVWTGEDAHVGLCRAYRMIYDRVRNLRHGLDRAFAEVLAAWTAHSGQPGGLLTVETVLPRVVAPVVRGGDRPVLIIVVDGMSTAIAADLVGEMTDRDWTEYDPLGGRTANRIPGRRRGAVAALPTVTTVSRASLLAATLTSGGQAAECAAFERLAAWQGRPARLFHQQTVHGEAGEVLGEDLVRALSDPDIVVGVVLNTVDDALDHGRESADANWRVSHVGPLRALLEHARYQGRAVILTSDHGHVLDRESSLRHIAAPVAARYRTDAAPAGDGEIEVGGPRVVGEDRIVALWDAGLRYLPRRAGYHGGVALAEVTVPVVALLPFGAAPPEGWAPVACPEPSWWAVAACSGHPAEVHDDRAAPDARADSAAITAPPPSRTRRNRRPASDPAAVALFDLPATAPSTKGDGSSDQSGAAPGMPVPSSGQACAGTVGAGSLVDRVLATEMFIAQHALTARRIPLGKVRGALTALIEANGVLPAVVMAQRAGEQAGRAVGFVTTLQRILNVDNFPVLSLADSGRTVRLDQVLLQEQFGLEDTR